MAGRWRHVLPTLAVLLQYHTAIAGSLLSEEQKIAVRAVAPEKTDPDDLSWITKWAAIGDSYASGVGAGNVLDIKHHRYDGSFVNLINQQLGQSVKGITFTDLTASGAKMDDITKMADELPGDQQAIVMSGAGNDINLVKVLNDCVYGWGILWNTSCGKTLDRISALVKSSDFQAKLDTLIAHAKQKVVLDGSGRIYWTGYAKFWDVTDRACDKISWHVWWKVLFRPYLTLENRQHMNQITEDLNQAISDAADRAKGSGGNVVFVNYDGVVGATGGRFCMPGVDEDKNRAADRDFSFFYQMNTVDTPLQTPNEDPFAGLNPNTPFRRSIGERATAIGNAGDATNLLQPVDPELIPNVEVAGLILEHKAADPDDTLNPDNAGTEGVDFLNDATNNIQNIPTPELTEINSNITTDGSDTTPAVANTVETAKRNIPPEPPQVHDLKLRTFHPNQNGHAIIANQVLFSMAVERAKDLAANAVGSYKLEASNAAGYCPLS